MGFIGRVDERNRLNSAIASERQEVVLLYGRRRIGKSELLHNCCDQLDCKVVFFQCRMVTESLNIESLSVEINKVFKNVGVSFNRFEDILNYLFDKAKNEKIVFVLDEYPFLRKSIEGCDSIIQAHIDLNRDDSNLKLILCGSYIDIMQSLLAYSNPLYGRFTEVINLKEMNYLETAMFYPNYSCEDKLKLYSVFGGVPFYNKQVNHNKSADQNIIDLVITPNAILRNEIDNYLSAEVSKLENANSVFEAIGKGKSKFMDIYSASGLNTDSALNNILHKLIGMEVLEKEFPINAMTDKKKANYRILDSLAAFYYRYISRGLVQIDTMGATTYFKEYILEDFETQYIPKMYERVCKQFLIMKNKEGMINPPLELIGKYYYDLPKEKKNGEFDIVAKDKNGYIFFEVKYTKEKITDSIIMKEIEQVEASPLDAYQYGFFSKNGFSLKKEYPYMLYKLEDIYK